MPYVYTILKSSSSLTILHRYQTQRYKRGRALFFCMLATMIFPPAFILLVHAYFKYENGSTSKKDKTLKGLEYSEFFWEILTKCEAGIESSGQLIVQTWLFSKILFDDKFSEQIPGFIGIISGMVLSKSATTTELSIGKMLLSIVLVVLSIGGTYRLQKRQSITFLDMIPIYSSLLVQILSRIFAFLIFFSTGQRFDVWMPTIFAIHFTVVLIIKMSLEFDWLYQQGTFSNIMLMYLRRVCLVLMGAATSFLVYVDMRGKEQRKRKSTFQVHFYYQLLILVENVFLAFSPMIVGNTMDNLPYQKLGQKWLVGLPLLVLASWLISCICTMLFYKFFHPWKAINGRNVKGALLCECTTCLRVHEADRVPAESDIEMEYFSLLT